MDGSPTLVVHVGVPLDVVIAHVDGPLAETVVSPIGGPLVALVAHFNG